jgi:dolichol-phosphate mannosyltransferase
MNGDGALIIIPTYNERENAPEIVRAVGAVVPKAHILFVDDGSPDGTGQVIDEMVARDGRIQVIHRQGKLGLGTAYIAGFRHGLARGYRFLIEMDADFSHNPKYLPDMLARAERADVVVGSRYVSGGGTSNWSLGRKLISQGGGLYSRTILGLRTKDLTAGFVCWNRRVLEALPLDRIRSSGYGFQIEMKYRAAKAGYTIDEMPIVFEDRRVGTSKMSRKIFVEALVMVWRMRFSA